MNTHELTSSPASPSVDRRRRPARFIRFALVFVLGLGALGWVVMSLWNAVLVPAANLHPLSYWQGLGLLLLTRILVGGWRSPGHRFGGAHHGRGNPWGNPERHDRSLTPEQRAELKARWKDR